MIKPTGFIDRFITGQERKSRVKDGGKVDRPEEMRREFVVD